MFRHRSSSSNSNDEDFDEDDDDDDDVVKRTIDFEKCYIYRNPQPVPTPAIPSPPSYAHAQRSFIKIIKKDNCNNSDNFNGNEQDNNDANDDDDDDDDDDDSNKMSSAFQEFSLNDSNNSNCFNVGYNRTQYSRSSVGGSKFLINVHPYNGEDYQDLVFESRFESGNLAKAVKITSTYYELYLRPDLYTSRHKQWFYFRVTNTKKNTVYRFSIVNLVKSDSLYNEGMRPLMYSTINAKEKGEGWRRCGENICYYRNDDESSSDEDDDNGSYTLTFNIQFPNDADTVYFAHSYPYTYTDLQDYLMDIQRHPIKSKFCKLRLLCRSLAGNNVYYLTVTAPSPDEEANKKKRAIIVTARVHPGETPSSWIMKGLMDFITGDSYAAKRLRHKFIFKLVPMLNPDGVIVGNTRSSLTGKDLNRQYRTVIRETYPSIWYTKAMIKRLIDDCGVAMYCDMHAHSRKHNIFIYGCENKRNPDKKLSEQVFPLMVHKNVADKFSFESCKFKIQRSKEGTGRIVIWMLGVTNSYTMEASFGGSTIGSRNGTHFSTADYEHMGRAFCETLLDYYDDNPIKERLRNKIIERLLKEGSSAEEPLNIPLSDYSSDEGDTSSSSDNEGKAAKYSDLEGPCCQPLKAPPCSPTSNFPDKIEEKRVKKIKVKYKSSNILKRKKSERTALDLPTTDPGSDIQFSTDDEELYVETDGYGTLPKSFKSPLANEQKKYEFDDQGNQRMPPELIVTPAKNKSSEMDLMKTIDREKKSLSPSITEFPPISGARRTNSWHSLNNKCISKISSRIQDNCITDTSESLHFKLSLKKKIWVGVVPNGAAGTNDRNRPLSWGIPPIARKTSNQITKDENEALLMACSQRLAALQKKELEKDSTDGSSLTESTAKEKKKRSKSKVTINLVVPVISEKLNKSRISNLKQHCSKTDAILEPKIKKKKNPLAKIAETTHLITRLAKSKAKTSLQNRKLVISGSNKGTGTSTTTTHSSTAIIHPYPSLVSLSKGHKFKTGGLVATAIQQPIKKKKSRLVPVIKSDNNAMESDQDKSFVKKAKAKIKKKRNKGNSNNAC